MVEACTYSANPGRVVFGDDTLGRVSDEIARLGLKRILLLSTRAHERAACALAQRLGDQAVGVFPGAVVHTPVAVTDKVMELVRQLDVDGLIAIGGGSTVGLGKAIAWRTDLPQIVIPTTYAGSELTPILGETVDGTKTTRTDAKILPEVVIYDVDLTLTLPAALSAASGMNAIAHAVEACYARDRNPLISLLAVEGIAVLAEALPRIAVDPQDRSARRSALYGAWLCGTCLGAVGMALHHKLCHVLGGLFSLPHAETHAIILPHALAYNFAAIGESGVNLQKVLGPDPAAALFSLCAQLGLEHSLREIGMPQSGIDEAASRSLANPYWNPRPLERSAIRALLARAWAGEPPESYNQGVV
jgi:maleylacetate reductase